MNDSWNSTSKTSKDTTSKTSTTYKAMASEKSSSMHTKDSQSIASWPSSITLRKPPQRPQPHYETYLLRLNPALKTIKTTTSICSIPLVRTYTHLPASYYIKPLRSSTSEIKSFLDASYARNRSNFRSSSDERGVREIKSQRDRDREAEERARSAILKMDDDAQREIQKLLEAREVATSGPRVKRVWDVVAIVQRWRRRIHDENAHPHHLQLMSNSGNDKKRFGRKKEAERPVEWVLVLKAEAVDFEDRTMPTRYGNPFDEDDSDADF
ncbi:hypothetical protein F5884DRAFT_851864 [Xylogone sp. PMI_703]|nr:hypothetical protein F5884DRAFT_851864 [Xylogone sp. PMI_703]